VEKTKKWSSIFPSILSGAGTKDAGPEEKAMRQGVNTYLISSHDKTALQFSFPLLIPALPDVVVDSRPEGRDGAVAAIIERIKADARRNSGLHPLAGIGTRHPMHYEVTIEPCTLIHAPQGVGGHLWRADHCNRFDEKGLHLEIHGALPHPGLPTTGTIRALHKVFSNLIQAITDETTRVPESVLAQWMACSLDQKLLRDRLSDLGLVAFIGDGTRPARENTEHRSYFRIAGRKSGVHIQFHCPEELTPEEIVLEGSNETITGLGIRENEAFAIIGSNAQGKSTLLQAILAGVDDHTPGDGREYVVTRPGAAFPQASGSGLADADVSLFFRSLPPGVDGTVTSAGGRGSGSLIMADQIQQALRKSAPLLFIDEDKAAANLLIPSCIKTEDVRPLSEILATDRPALNGSAFVFAASSMDLLIAEADRILLLVDHKAGSISREQYRENLIGYLSTVCDLLRTGRCSCSEER